MIKVTYPGSDKTIHTRLDQPELVRYDGDKLGFAVSTLSEPDDNGKLAGYLVFSFDKKEKFLLLASAVAIVDPGSREDEIRKYKKSQRRPKAPKTIPKPEKQKVESRGLAEILATAEVGEHDTALSYATELVKQVRKDYGIDFSVRDNVLTLYAQFVDWAGRNGKPIIGIDPENLMDRIEGELFFITKDKLLKHAPYPDARDEAAVIEAGYKRPRAVKDASAVTPRALAPEHFGKYAYHTTSFINLYVIAESGLLRNAGGSPGGSCYLAEDIEQRDNSIEHSKQVIAAALGRYALNTYVNQREDRADKVVADDNTARKADEADLQSDLDEHAALLRFKITAEHEWVTDPQDSRALLLGNKDVAPAELECLTSEGWVPVTTLVELGAALHYDDGAGGTEFQVFVRQSERVRWRLSHEPTDNDILEGQAFVERGSALLTRLDVGSTPHAQVAMAITQLKEKLSTLRAPVRASKD